MIHPMLTLSLTQAKIILLLARGYSQRQIAYHLKVSQATVQAHLLAIRTKTKTQSTIQAITTIVVEPYVYIRLPK